MRERARVRERDTKRYLRIITVSCCRTHCIGASGTRDPGFVSNCASFAQLLWQAMSTFVVEVFRMSGAVAQLRVSYGCTVRMLKKRIARATGTRACFHRVVSGERVLRDAELLSDCAETDELPHWCHIADLVHKGDMLPCLPLTLTLVDGVPACTKCSKRCHEVRYCAGCHRALYCSKHCQKHDWSYHKTKCGM